uniref:Uncharacterized protein n=1 Tax=Micrurus surinamensis TaxID=129470 RepID=A0A2D4PXK1_MICSU
MLPYGRLVRQEMRKVFLDHIKVLFNPVSHFSSWPCCASEKLTGEIRRQCPIPAVPLQLLKLEPYSTDPRGGGFYQEDTGRLCMGWRQIWLGKHLPLFLPN